MGIYGSCHLGYFSFNNTFKSYFFKLVNNKTKLNNLLKLSCKYYFLNITLLILTQILYNIFEISIYRNIKESVILPDDFILALYITV